MCSSCYHIFVSTNYITVFQQSQQATLSPHHDYQAVLTNSNRNFAVRSSNLGLRMSMRIGVLINTIDDIGDLVTK